MNIMKLKSLSLLFLFFLYFIGNAFALSGLSAADMKRKTGQSGLSLAISDAVIYHQSEYTKLIDDNESSNPGYINFKNIKDLETYNTGDVDLDNDGTMGHLNIDIQYADSTSSGYQNPYMVLECSDWDGASYLKVGEIDFSGYSIGSLDILEKRIPEWNLYLGAHDAGIDFEFGFKMDITSFKYKYGDSVNNYYLGFEGVHMAGDFTDNSLDDPSDSSTWKSNGRFKVGEFSTDSPATFDIGVRDTDSEPVISISTPMKGSIRIENIHMGDKNFGPAAIDGINVHRMKIELPGRNLGNS